MKKYLVIIKVGKRGYSLNNQLCGIFNTEDEAIDWVLNNTATQEQINELVDVLNNKRRIIVEHIDPDVVVDGTDNIYIGITSQAENSFISIYIDISYN